MTNKIIFISLSISLSLTLPISTLAQENNAITCADGIDNDGDGLIDCEDGGCAILPNQGCATCLEDGLSFADEVIASNIACADNLFDDPQAALGLSDFLIGGYVSLGGGGSITLGFTNNLVINSGNDAPDVWVFEIGPLVEASSLELRPCDQFTIDILNAERIPDADGDGFFDFGEIAGSLSSLDIDAVVPGLDRADLKFNAIEITDVAGRCNGLAPGVDIDAVCALSSIGVGCNETDCAGTPNGNAELDACGECLEPSDPDFNQSCLDCAGTPYGTAEVDDCGECLEPSDPNFNQSCVDCAGTPNGTAEIDACGECLEPADPNFNQSCMDCTGTPNGTAEVDACGECLEPADPNFNQSCEDCAGTPNGTAQVDICGECLQPTDPDFDLGCLSEDIIFIPNAFSPNGDGNNDKFKIYIRDGINANITSYLIFDRWGGKVFESKNIDFNNPDSWWDGNINGRPSPTGIYIYALEVEFPNGIIKQYKGEIHHLIR